MATFGTLDPASYTLVWRDSFTDNSGLDRGLFPITWGNAADIVAGNGVLTITSRAAAGWSNAGFIQSPSGVAGGQGYGLYSVTAALNGGEGIGACFGLWPADNVWPGAELDMLESFDASRASGYSAIHSRAANGGDAYDSYTLATDLTRIHTYALDWEPGRLTYYIDGQLAYTTTSHVPLDYAHGGVNEVFAAQVTNAGSAPVSQSVSLKLYDISYSQLNLGVAVPAPPVAPTPATVEFGNGPDTLIIWTTENAYNGNAQYTIKVDGVQVGGVQTAIAWDGAGMGADKVTVHGNWGGGGHVVTLTFLNDAYGGTAATDRNLYVEAISYDGAAQARGSEALLSGGPVGFSVAGAATTLSLAGFGQVWADDFSHDTQLNRTLFPVMWGDAADFRFADGGLTLTSYAAKNWQALGFLQYDGGASAGQGYGLYQVSAALEAGQGAGICLCLWPADNRWPGPELDLLESWDASRRSGFTSVHWQAADGSDGYDSYAVALDLTQRHSYALDWAPGQLAYYVDGRLLYVITGHVPLDYAHGGLNETFGAVVSAAGINPTSSSVALHLYSMSYSAPLARPPAVSIAHSGGAVAQASQVIGGSGVAGGSVQLWDGDARLGPAVTVDATGAWAVTVTLAGFGAHAISATQTDDFGQASSAALALTLLRPALENAGGTWLTALSGGWQLVDSGSGAGPELRYGGTAVVAGAGAWAPLGAEAVAGGYQVAWKQIGRAHV